jgi:hypothetical protein
MGDAEWGLLTAQLRRLLRVEAKAFQETSADDPVVTWLVVRLGAIAGIRMTNTTTEARMGRIRDVLAAVALLYEKGASTSGSQASRAAFWTRVLMSDMMRDAAWASMISLLTRSLAQTPVCILLDWSQLKMADSTVVSLLESVLVRRPRPPHVPPMTIGVRLLSRDVTPVGLASLDALWTQYRHSTQTLVAMDRIGRIVISDSTLPPECVDALTMLLNHHPVDDLGLDRGAISDVAPFSTIVSIVLGVAASRSRPTRLSLSNCALNVHHVKVIADTLATSTRPLAGLSLVNSLPTGQRGLDSCWWWLARIMFFIESPITATDEQHDSDAIAELDMSDTMVSNRDIRCFHDSLVAMAVDSIGDAPFDNLWCGVKPNAKRFFSRYRNQTQSSLRMDESREYRVNEMHPGGWVRISRPVEGWVPIEGVAFFRSHDITFRLRPRFNALVLNNVKASDGHRTLGNLIATVGSSKLRKLSARDTSVYHMIEPIVERCPRLTHLDLHGEYVMGHLENWIRYRGQNIVLPHLRQLSFRASNQFGFDGLRRFLDQHPTIEVVEMTHSILFTVESAAFLVKCEQLVLEQDGRELETVEPATERKKHAFLSVPMARSLAPPLVAIVWAFAVSRARRRILWQPQPLLTQSQ